MDSLMQTPQGRTSPTSPPIITKKLRNNSSFMRGNENLSPPPPSSPVKQLFGDEETSLTAGRCPSHDSGNGGGISLNSTMKPSLRTEKHGSTRFCNSIVPLSTGLAQKDNFEQPPSIPPLDTNNEDEARAAFKLPPKGKRIE